MNWLNGTIYPLDFGAGGPVRFQWTVWPVSGPDCAPKWVHTSVPGRELPYQEFVGGGEQPISLTARFTRHTKGKGNVKSSLDALRALTKPLPLGAGGKKRPPILKLRLGIAIIERCTLQEVGTELQNNYDPNDMAPYDGIARLTFCRYDNES